LIGLGPGGGRDIKDATATDDEDVARKKRRPDWAWP
jgi:hypothetical protein